MKITIGSDHAGYALKEELKKHLSAHEIEDMGTDSDQSVDYPDYAAKVASAVQKEGIGILVCGTGLGVCISANKFSGIRAVPCRDTFEAQMSREHNDANILCLGARTTDSTKAKKIVDTFLSTNSSKEPRHINRVHKIDELEKHNFK